MPSPPTRPPQVSPARSGHLIGGLACLQLGPAAHNRFGGREAALPITRALAKA